MGAIRRPEQATRLAWNAQQERLAARRVDCDRLDFAVEDGDFRGLKRIAGVDLSFFPDSRYAVAAVVVLSFPKMEVLFERCATLELEVPYVPGYLAFREVPALAAMLESVQPHMKPQVVFVDGNGAHHPRRCGAATHLGVVLDVPTIGVAKDVLLVGSLGCRRADEILRRELHETGDWAPFAEDGEEALAALIRAGEPPRRPLVVSPGHRVCLRTAVSLVLAASHGGGGVAPLGPPEPIRQADLRSRQAVQAWLGGSPLPELVVTKRACEEAAEEPRKRKQLRWREKGVADEAKVQDVGPGGLPQLQLCLGHIPTPAAKRARGRLGQETALSHAAGAGADDAARRAGGRPTWRPKAAALPLEVPAVSERGGSAANLEEVVAQLDRPQEHWRAELSELPSRECCGLGALPRGLWWLLFG